MSKHSSAVRSDALEGSSRGSTRDGFGKELLALGKDRRVVALTADLGESTRVHWFAQKYPGRFVECGVAEQNMVGVSAGLALAGKIPFAASFAVFVPGRCWDHIRVQVAYNRANVKLCATHAGLATGEDGATHQALEDVALMRSLPHITVVVPCDAIEARKATRALAALKGPAYLRLGRAELPLVTAEKAPFRLGKAEVLRKGSDVSIVACGAMVHQALLAAQQLERQGIDAMVINNHTIKPLDMIALVDAAKTTGAVVTVEEHQVSGGLGSAVLEALAGVALVPVELVGVQDSFGQSGTPAQLWEKFGLSVRDIVAAAKSAIAKKASGECFLPHGDAGMARLPRSSLGPLPPPIGRPGPGLRSRRS